MNQALTKIEPQAVAGISIEQAFNAVMTKEIDAEKLIAALDGGLYSGKYY